MRRKQEVCFARYLYDNIATVQHGWRVNCILIYKAILYKHEFCLIRYISPMTHQDKRQKQSIHFHRFVYIIKMNLNKIWKQKTCLIYFHIRSYRRYIMRIYDIISLYCFFRHCNSKTTNKMSTDTAIVYKKYTNMYNM